MQTLSEYLKSQTPEELKNNLENVHKKLDDIVRHCGEEIRKMQMQHYQEIIDKRIQF